MSDSILIAIALTILSITIPLIVFSGAATLFLYSFKRGLKQEAQANYFLRELSVYQPTMEFLLTDLTLLTPVQSRTLVVRTLQKGHVIFTLTKDVIRINNETIALERPKERPLQLTALIMELNKYQYEKMGRTTELCVIQGAGWQDLLRKLVASVENDNHTLKLSLSKYSMGITSTVGGSTVFDYIVKIKPNPPAEVTPRSPTASIKPSAT